MESAITLAIFAVQQIIKQYPALKQGFKDVFSKDDPTPEDWDALRAKVLSKSYRDYVPETKIPATE